jgi:peptide chain release factor subunit 1
LQRSLDLLDSKAGRHTELISLYVPKGKQISDVTNALREEYSTASNIKSRTTRRNVLDALERVMQRLRLFKELPTNGLVIFCGAIPQNGEGSEEIETYVIEPPEPTPIYYYRCDQRFHTEPLHEMLREKEAYGIIAIDGNEAAIATLRGRNLNIVKELTSGLPGKHRAGGQSSRRFERLREQEVNDYYKRVGQHVNDILLQVPDLKGIILGGPGPTKDDFSKGDYLQYTLKNRILGIVDTAYSGEEGLSEVVEKATDILKEVRYVEEKNLVQSFLYELGHDTGRVTYGEDEVRSALKRGVVRTLLISEGFVESRVTAKCQSCGYVETTTVKGENPEKITQRLEAQPCPKCSGNLKVVEIEDAVDNLAKIAEDTGAEVEIISTQTEEGNMLKDSFGGIAAILRYKQE